MAQRPLTLRVEPLPIALVIITDAANVSFTTADVSAPTMTITSSTAQ